MLPPIRPHTPFPMNPENGAADPYVAALQNRVAMLEARLARLEAIIGLDNANNVVINSDADIKLEAAGSLEAHASAEIKLAASAVQMDAGMYRGNVPLSKFWGIVECDTMVTTTVVAASYTPGMGNLM